MFQLLECDSGLIITYSENVQLEKLNQEQTEGGQGSQTDVPTGQYIH